MLSQLVPMLVIYLLISVLIASLLDDSPRHGDELSDEAIAFYRFLVGVGWPWFLLCGLWSLAATICSGLCALARGMSEYVSWRRQRRLPGARVVSRRFPQ